MGEGITHGYPVLYRRRSDCRHVRKLGRPRRRYYYCPRACLLGALFYWRIHSDFNRRWNIVSRSYFHSFIFYSNLFFKQKRVDFKSGWLLFITCGPGAMLGSYTTQYVNAKSFQLGFGIFMLFMAVLLILRDYLKPLDIKWSIERTYTDGKGQTFQYGYSVLPVLVIGLAVGFIAGLFGVGGGALLVPVMVILFRYPPMWLLQHPCLLFYSPL